MDSQEAELIRKKYKYRRLVLTGKIVLPHEEAALLLGPDCAYHLYSLTEYNSRSDLKDNRPRKVRK